MKILRLALPVLAGMAMAAGTLTAFARGRAAPASPPALVAMETDLTSTGDPLLASGAENMHADASGRLWISQDTDGADYVRVFDPATHAYTDYTGLISPNDAQLGPDGNVWWGIDSPAAGLARLDLASRTVTTWSVPAGSPKSLAFDSSNRVWGLLVDGSAIYTFAADSNQLCKLALPDGGAGGPFLTQQNGAFWLGLYGGSSGHIAGLARITDTTNVSLPYTFWSLGDNVSFETPNGVTFAPNSVVWFSGGLSSTIGRLETAANRVTLFNPPGGETAQSVDYFLGKVWFTGQTEDSATNGDIGALDPATATGTTPQVVTTTTTVLTPVCVDAGAAHTFMAGISTGVSAFSPLPLTTTVGAQGISYGTPISSQPAALVRFGSTLWLTDQGRNKLIEAVIPTTDLYLPLVRK